MKKHILLFVVFIFVLCGPGLAQWQWQYPVPQGNRLNNMLFIEGTGTGYAIGNGGVILKSNNKGITWSLMDSVALVNLNGIFFTDPSTGFIVGDNGVVLTTDASGQWTPMESGTHYHLNAVGAPSADQVFAAGYKGLLLKKSGNEWEEVESPAIHTLYCIDFASSSVGIAAGDSGTILRTPDGGATWNSIDVPFETAFLDVFFPSENIGFLTGQKGVILKTTDAGSTWTNISYSQVESNLLSIHFHNDTSGYACGAKGVILSTTNGGASWIYHDKKTTLSFNEIIQLDPPQDTICDTVIFCGDNGIIFRSDSCLVKLNNVTHGSSNTLSSIRFPAENKGFAVGGDPFNNKPFLLKTEDGENWSEIKYDTIKRYLTAIDFIDTARAYISSTGGFVYRFLIDSAVPLKTGFPDHLYAIRALDTATIYTAGLNGSLLKTISGDTTWKKLVTNTTKHLYSLYFFNGNTGYAVGEGGIMLRIGSGGNQITKITTGLSVPLYDIYFKNENIGFIVGYNGRILKVDRSSGVEVFQQIPSGVTTPLNEIYFPNSNVGYISGEGGVVLKTTDGGDSWLPQHSGTQNGLRSLFFKDEAEGWAAGEGVTILKTDNGGGAVITPGIGEHPMESYAINLYPNPATNQTRIGFELIERNRVTISTYDLSGRRLEVVADEFRQGKVMYSYNTSGLPKGIYLLIIDIGNTRQGQKLVILK